MLVTILGSYAHAANPKLLNAQDNSHDVIIYDLKGRRLSFIDEGPKRGHEATERLKQLAGGGSLTGRPMRGNPVTSRPTHTFVMTTNNEPNLTDPALRARVRLIPCNADEADVRPARLALLGQALHTEAPGILAAMMRETAAYLADRDTASTAAAPIIIRGAAQEIAERQDPTREWVETCTGPAAPGTPGRVLYTSFAAWHQNNPLYRRMSVPTETAFGRTLNEMGFPAEKINKLSYRPLSVLHGPGSPVGPTPSPTAFMAPGSSSTAASNARRERVETGFAEGSQGQPSQYPPGRAATDGAAPSSPRCPPRSARTARTWPRPRAAWSGTRWRAAARPRAPGGDVPDLLQLGQRPRQVLADQPPGQLALQGDRGEGCSRAGRAGPGRSAAVP
jgi:hypothetical protein